jgi:hypothetical protein
LVAPTGLGKGLWTTTQLLTWNGSAIVNDLKGLGVLAPVHPRQSRRGAGGEERDDLVILHHPHLLAGEEGPEAAELALRNAGACGPRVRDSVPSSSSATPSR